MHDTHVKMKNGDKYQAPMMLFRPELGFMTLMGVDQELRFDDMESAVTPSERGGPEDELTRAKQLGWDPSDGGESDVQ